MRTRLIASTEAQNNFGRMLDDAVQNSTRYVIRRRNASQAILLSIADFESLLVGDEAERKKLEKVIRELSPLYSVGESVAE
jgi:PHD/YefM family antitoxin component YafN of YafNO toxin-antitoxin module